VATERQLGEREGRSVQVEFRAGQNAQKGAGAHSHREGKQSVADKRDRSDQEHRSAPREFWQQLAERGHTQRSRDEQ
jgi:hypothetical protein